MFNKYDSIPTEGLIRAIQRTAISLNDPDYCKRVSIGRRGVMKKDLDLMRNSAIERLKKLDRCSPGFFPVGAHVEHRKVEPVYYFDDIFTHPEQEKPRDGIVVGNTADRCLVQYPEEEYRISVDPRDLKLKFIRE